MDNPKVSVIIPLYNRKQYAAQCIDSALNQTFQDYEIVIRDDCSTDGVFEFVQEKYTQQISEGKIRLLKNEENIGETRTIWQLCHDASGKYIAILHNDDMYLSHALQHLYEIAEKTNADVVHESFFLNSPKDGIINSLKDCRPACCENHTFDKIVIMPDKPLDRFKEWVNGGIFWDSQYNIFNRDFLLKNNIFECPADPLCMALWWIMAAKVFVKTPVICYVHRDSPYSSSNAKYSPERLERFISNQFKTLRNMNKRFAEIDFFKNNEYFQYMAKARLLGIVDNFHVTRRKVYANGITPEIYQAAARAFKKECGEDYFYPMFLFNWIHTVPYSIKVENINFENFNPQKLQ